MEEAKKNMYAFSTTTYTGFQCTVSEETSEKFKGNTLFTLEICFSSPLISCMHVPTFHMKFVEFLVPNLTVRHGSSL